MTKTEALQMLAQAERSDEPSRVNPSFTRAQAVGIVESAIDCLLSETVPPILAKRVAQACQNRKRPRL